METTAATDQLHVHPIDPQDLAEIRRRGTDLFGHTPEERVSDGGNQLRCCLRYSRAGERLWLISHAPLTAPRPWREVGPVFVHPEPCGGYDAADGIPSFLGRRPRVLRCYTADQAMYYPGNRITRDGEDLERVLREIFSDPQVSEIHVRNLEAQCFIARVTR